MKVQKLADNSGGSSFDDSIFNLEKLGSSSEITLNGIIQEANELESEESEEIGLFIVKSATKWIKEAQTRPIPKMLFGVLWFQYELCILFADTNLGKSILAVQIGESISKGSPIKGYELEAGAQKVLYFDFELSDKQFENRYSKNFSEHYLWNENFIRVEINPESELPDGVTFEDFLYNSLEQSIIKTQSKILIIDNITYLKQETEKAKDALPLMKELKALKKKYDLSILCLAHTPKRDLSKPITRNDLQGSKMLINFCDSSFTIGESHQDKSVRYIKQIKARQTEIVFDAENVIISQIIKPDNFLHFEFIDYGTELEHLKQLTEKDRQSMIEKAKELSEQGMSQRKIASQLGLSLGAVNKYLKK